MATIYAKDRETSERMYSAGYRCGQRLAAYPMEGYRRANDDCRALDLVNLGDIEYADGFEDGHGGRVPTRPLRLTEEDNHFVLHGFGYRSPNGIPV